MSAALGDLKTVVVHGLTKVLSAQRQAERTEDSVSVVLERARFLSCPDGWSFPGPWSKMTEWGFSRRWSFSGGVPDAHLPLATIKFGLAELLGAAGLIQGMGFLLEKEKAGCCKERVQRSGKVLVLACYSQVSIQVQLDFAAARTRHSVVVPLVGHDRLVADHVVVAVNLEEAVHEDPRHPPAGRVEEISPPVHSAQIMDMAAHMRKLKKYG